MIDEFELIEDLQLVTSRLCKRTEATAAALLLPDQHGQMHFMAASDEQMRNLYLELFQVQANGPLPGLLPLRYPGGDADLD